MKGDIDMKGFLCTLIMILMTSGCMSLQQKNATLLQAARTGDTPTVQRMLEKGANIDIKDYNRDTPLLIAVKNERTETVAMLASHGANLNATDKFGDTPLNLAIRNDQHDTARLLVAKGADINAKGALDDTPLHTSVYKSDNEMASLLRSKGADESLLNRYGLNPEEMQAIPEVEEKVIATARLISSSGEWTDRYQARALYDELKLTQDRYLVNALVLQIIRGHDMRLRVLLLAIKLGISGSEEKLNNLLIVYGEKSMAEDYLNSGSSLLHSGASRWAADHGYHIRTGPGSHRSNWGRF
jgi:ankyrin repeat protein